MPTDRNAPHNWQDGSLYDDQGILLAWTPRLADGFAACICRDKRDVTLATGLTEESARRRCEEELDVTD